MARCYSCTDLIDKSNHSLEHLINNSIGGSIGSYDLLCKKCNDSFGRTIDGELSEQLGGIAVLLKIKRDRKTAQRAVNMISETGMIKKVGGGLKPHLKLSYATADKQVEIFASEDKYEKLVRNKTKELSKKHPVIFVESTELPTKEKWHIKTKYSDAVGNGKFGGILMHRAVAKIALNRYLYKGFDPAHCKVALDFVLGKEKPYPQFYYFPKHYQIHQLAKDEVSHIVHLCGDHKNRVVYAYVELFNFENSLIIFDMDYDGEDFSDTHAIDTFTGKEIEKHISIRLHRNHFEALGLICEDFYKKYMECYNRILQIIEKRQLIN